MVTLLVLGLYTKLVADMDFNLIYDWAINNCVLIDQLAESQTSSRGEELLGKIPRESSHMDIVWTCTKISNLHFSSHLILSQLS